jgi:hypothetical protein
MAIEKYGKALFCGYGVFSFHGFGECGNGFNPNVRIFANSKITTRTESEIKGFPQNYESCFVVYDGEEKTWKEYFTGIILTFSLDYSGGLFDVDNMGTNKIKKSFSIGYFKALGIDNGVQILTATKFAEEIADLSEEQIRDKVKRIYEMQEQAKRWGVAFDKAVQSVREERARKEAELTSVEAKLAAGFGMYGKSAIIDQKPAKNEQNEDVNPQEWIWQERIRQGHCMYCGGAFRGVLIKRCGTCGKLKSY